jgi:hypothetical protein
VAKIIIIPANVTFQGAINIAGSVFRTKSISPQAIGITDHYDFIAISIVIGGAWNAPYY